jgi:hypothetical protein
MTYPVQKSAGNQTPSYSPRSLSLRVLLTGLAVICILPSQLYAGFTPKRFSKVRNSS